MAVIGKDEILEYLKTSMGESPDDASISFLENVTDTINDYEAKVSDKEDWKTKYEENDKEWRKKYTDRFFSGDPNETPPADPDPDPEPHTPMRFEDLFKEVKGD